MEICCAFSALTLSVGWQECHLACKKTAATVFRAHRGRIVAACCPQAGTLSSFSALMLFVGWQEGHPSCKSSATRIPKSLLRGIGLTWSNLSWSNSRNIGRLSKNGLCVWVYDGSLMLQMETWSRELMCWWRKCLTRSWLVKELSAHSVMHTGLYCRLETLTVLTFLLTCTLCSEFTYICL